MRRTLLPFVALVSLAACRSNERAAGTAATGGTVIMATSGDASSIFPPYVQDITGAAVRDQIYDRLAEIGDGLNTVGDAGFQPRLATRWEWAKDSLSIAFHLDPRARWHDGTPVRASDVRFSFDLFQDTTVASSVAPLITNIDSVSVRDSLTPVVWYKQRRPEQFYDFVYQIYIMPEHVFGKVPRNQLRTADVTRKAVGTGRFRLARWDAGQRIELVADTTNYRGRAKLDRVIWSVSPDFGTALAQLMSGQADFFDIIPPELVPRVDSSRTLHTIPYPALQYAYMGMNLHDPKQLSRPHPIFGDRRVRRALSMALDRKAMLQNVFGSQGKLSHGPFPSSIGVADTNLVMIPYDTAAASALLDSAGWTETTPGGVRQKNGRPLRFPLLVLVSSKSRMAYAVLIQNQLRKVGVQADLDQVQAGVAYQRQISHDFDAALIAQGMGPSPGEFKQQWGSEGAPKGGQNYVGYMSRTFDAYVDSALATTDPSKTRAYMARAFQTAIDDAPAVWLYDISTIAGAHRRIQLAPMRADAWWAHLADWSIPPDARIDRDRIGLGTRP